MTVSPLAATTASASSMASSSGVTKSGSTLNQSDFLKLLVAQMQFQDPLNPKSNTDMAAQMAQFTALQQSTESSASLAMIQANSLIGSKVTLQIDSTTSTTGVVSGVVMNNGIPQITVGGSNYNLNQVVSVTPQTTAPTTSSSGATN
jgi:flagellar basal-body rod modification protein FlgD